MTKTELIEQSFHLDNASMNFLLRLRIILDQSGSQLESDIADLYGFPERLEGSYRDEWVSYIKKQLVQRAFNNSDYSPARNLSHFMEQQYEQRGEDINLLYEKFSQTLKDIEHMQSTENVVLFKYSLKNSIESLMQ